MKSITYKQSIKHHLDHSLFKLSEIATNKNEIEVFDYWTRSDLAQIFFKVLQKNKQDIRKSSKELIKIEKERLNEWQKVLLEDKKNKRKYFLEDAGDLPKKVTAKIYFDKNCLQIISPYKKEFEEHLFRTTKALILLKKYDPNGYKTFFEFTNTIVVINRKEFVSFSSQDLPAISSLNYFHRDFVDHMDDLLHENGHHVLNEKLRKHHLIQDSQEQIFYSPWRRTLRPVRGIYHAYLTFFWAMTLFKNLIKNDALKTDELTLKEKNKIVLRFCEEFLMLDYSRHDLNVAYKMKLVTNLGMKLVLDKDKDLLECRKLYKVVFKKLSKKDQVKISKLEALLKNKRRDNLIKL